MIHCMEFIGKNTTIRINRNKDIITTTNTTTNITLQYPLGSYKNMDNNQTWQASTPTSNPQSPQMQNWKKQLLMDPILNTLFDPTLTPQQFMTSKIQFLPHNQIAGLYSKLSSIHFQITDNVRKEVERKSQFIEKSFGELMEYKGELEEQENRAVSDSKSHEYLNHLKTFNKKYETVEQSLTLWHNITQTLHFSKAYQKFKVDTNIIKTRMRGYNGTQDTINCSNIAKMLKQIFELSLRYDFIGMKGFENERVFISSTKSIVHAIACKNLPKLLVACVGVVGVEVGDRQQRELLGKQIEEWIGVFANLGTLRDFVINYGKSVMRDIPEQIKKAISKNDLPNLQRNMSNILLPYLCQTNKAILLLQQKLAPARKHEPQLANIPNLFQCIWQKQSTTLKEILTLLRKQQQTKNIPKIREQNLIWKYPILYMIFSKLCTEVQMYMVEGVVYNGYNFGKYRERVMVGALLELGVGYQGARDRVVGEMRRLFTSGVGGSKPAQQENSEQSSPPSQQPLHLSQQSTKSLQNYISTIETLLKQCKSEQIYNSLMNSLCGQLQNMDSQFVQKQQQLNKQEKEEAQVQERRYYVLLINSLRIGLKVVIGKYGASFGITRQQLEAFRLSK